MGPSKSTSCSICNKTFSRSDHLKRHQLRHSGLKPYCCAFCSQPFTRSDILKDHYQGCPQRGGRVIPEPARQGRRSHACSSCTVAKLGCDGNRPCQRCRIKDIECNFVRLQPSAPAIDLLDKPHGSFDDSHRLDNSELGNGTITKTTNGSNSLSDRGSIKFLLNSGTASFIECFRFPSSWERKNLNDLRESANDSADDPLSGSNPPGSYGDDFVSDLQAENIDWSIFDDESFLRFFSSPFGEGDSPSHGLFAALQDDVPPASLQQCLSASPTAFTLAEPASGKSATIIRALRDTALTLHLSPEETAEISRHLNYLYTRERTERFCDMYFEFWHPHCPIVHRPSFAMESTPTALLVPITLMGAMYSTVDREVSTAKLLLDLAELFAFSIDDLRDDFEIQQIIRLSSATQPARNITMSPLALDHVRAAHLMVCLQYWAGNTLAKRRVVDTRFGVAVKVARRIGLTQAKHQDFSDEYTWIQRETRIRTVNIMVLLDCAFTFFANFPCRFSFSELEFELPCAEAFFNSSQPFVEDGFSLSRRPTILSAFQSLFEQADGRTPLMNPSQFDARPAPLDLNCMDMFILIHLLYICAHTQVTMFSSPRFRGAGRPISSAPSGDVTPTTVSSRSLIDSALTRWRTLWAVIRAKISNREWANLGFCTNGFHYWLVTQLLVSHPGSSDLLKGMQVNCEDTLKHIRTLLRDPGNDT